MISVGGLRDEFGACGGVVKGLKLKTYPTGNDVPGVEGFLAPLQASCAEEQRGHSRLDVPHRSRQHSDTIQPQAFRQAPRAARSSPAYFHFVSIPCVGAPNGGNRLRFFEVKSKVFRSQKSGLP